LTRLADIGYAQAVDPRAEDRLVERRVLADEAAVARMLRRLASEIVEKAGGTGDLALVGIRTGGLVVAQSMIRAASTPLPVLALTCRRELTKVKSRLKAVRTLLSALPQPTANLLRRVEHRLITAPSAHRAQPRQIDRTEVENIGHCVTMLPAPTRILVIDDAVDSGATLATALQVLRNVCPPGTEIRSAVITQTLDRPIVRADYVLHRGTLCRFPWSFDAAR